MLEAIKAMALERGKEHAVRCAAQEAMWEAAECARGSSEAEAIGVWRRKQQAWLALCRQDPEIKICVLKRTVRAVSLALHDLLDSHGVWK